MAGASQEFGRIRHYVGAIVGIVVASAVGLVALAFFLNSRIQEIETVRTEYHLSSLRHAVRIRGELHTIESNLLIRQAVGSDRVDPLSSTDIELANLRRENQTALGLLRGYGQDLQALQRRFQAPAFAALVERLVGFDHTLTVAMDPQFDHQDYLDSKLPGVAAVAHQLELLHVEAERALSMRVGDLTDQSFMIFLAIAITLGFTGLLVSVRGVHSIELVVEDNATTRQLLEQSQTRISSILDTVADGIITIETDGTIQTFNETAGAIFGYAPDEIIGKNVSSLIPEHASTHHGPVQRFLDTGVKNVIGTRREVEGLRKDGTVFSLELGVTEMSINGQPMFNGIVRDLSDQKRAEEQSLKLQKALSESLNEIYIFDSETLKFSYVNQGALNNLGYTEAEMSEMNPLDLKPEYTEAQFRELVRPLLDQRRSEIIFETVHRRKDDTLYPVEARLSLTRWEGGAFFLAVILDTTERKKHEVERLRLEEQMQRAQKLESLGVLAGGIAHDFNNLLVGILGNAELAQQELSPVSPAVASIKEIETASIHAAELCRQMLAYAGKGRFLIELIDLNEVIEEMGHLLEVSIAKNAILKYDLSDNLPLVDADATQMRQVIMNLITNASDAIGAQTGVILLSTGALECDRDYLDSTYMNAELHEGMYVYFDVADTGSGMDAATQESLFDPFYTTKFTGRGLGLAAVLGIVRGHGGAVKIYSELNRGTTFKVLIPVSEARAIGPRADAQDEARGWRGEGKVLFVDDEEAVVTVGKRLLEASGFTVLTAANGIEALQIYKEHQAEIACVLLDLTMAPMDGEETYRELRKIDEDVCVILSSGYSEQEISGRFAGKGLAAFIHKPYRLIELKQTLREVLGDPQS